MSTADVEVYDPSTGEVVDVAPSSAVRSAVESLAAGNKSVFSSITGDDFASKLKVLQATTASEALADNLNKTIFVKDIVIQIVPMKNEQTGKVEEQPRTILVTDDGIAYHAISRGLFNSVENMLGILGQPGEWPHPMPIIARREGEGARKYFTLYPDMSELAKLSKAGK